MHKRLFPYLTPFSLATASSHEQTVELRDGGRVIVKKDGTWVCFDAEGKRVALGEGHVLEAKDGTQFMVKDNTLWKQVGRKRPPNPKG